VHNLWYIWCVLTACANGTVHWSTSLVIIVVTGNLSLFVHCCIIMMSTFWDTEFQNTPPFRNFLYTSVKNKPILILFGIRNLKTIDISIYTLVHCTCKMSPRYLIKCITFPSGQNYTIVCQTLDNFQKKQMAIILPRNLNYRLPLSKKLLQVTVVCVDIPVYPSCLFDIDLSPCFASIHPMSQKRTDASLHGCYAFYAVSLYLVHMSDYSVNL